MNDGLFEITCQLQRIAVTKRKKLEKRDCAHLKDFSKSFHLLMYFFHFDKNKSLKTLFEVIFYEKIFMTF